MAYVLAIDQGTTSTRAIVYDEAGQALGSAGQEFTQYFPRPGWVEHDPLEIWRTVCRVIPQAVEAAGLPRDQIAAIGVTNQRETVVLWERSSGQPLARAIVWQDRRTADFCRERHADAAWLAERSGLVLDPYFSATKLRWLLEQNPEWRLRVERGELAAGTIDSWLIWKLTGGRAHVTDVSNASRTLLVNVHSATWDDDLCRYFQVPRALLAEIRPSVAPFGATAGLEFLPDGIPIAGVAGDQQAALFGQGGFSSGAAKCTYGTGAFFLQHTGDRLIQSKHRLLSSLAATVDERREYVIEGSVFVAGAAVQWLRDGIKLFGSSHEVENLAASSDLEEPVLFVPSFVGLGAPYWVPEARGVLFGLTRNTTGQDLARAALEGVAYQIADLLEAAGSDTQQPLESLRVDGGMARNAWFLQAQADILGRPVLQSPVSEATALGAAFLAGLHVGIWPNRDALRPLIPTCRRFEARLPEPERQRRRQRWQRAIRATLSFYAQEADG